MVLLAQSDVPIIYAHVGTGVNEQWENIKDIKMEKEGAAVVELIPQDEQINFCFTMGQVIGIILRFKLEFKP